MFRQNININNYIKIPAPGAVLNLKVERPTDSFTQMKVSWSIPLLRDQNGVIKNYIIEHNVTGVSISIFILYIYKRRFRVKIDETAIQQNKNIHVGVNNK